MIATWHRWRRFRPGFRVGSRRRYDQNSADWFFATTKDAGVDVTVKSTPIGYSRLVIEFGLGFSRARQRGGSSLHTRGTARALGDAWRTI
jgi:hypothetical protein